MSRFPQLDAMVRTDLLTQDAKEVDRMFNECEGGLKLLGELVTLASDNDTVAPSMMAALLLKHVLVRSEQLEHVSQLLSEDIVRRTLAEKD